MDGGEDARCEFQIHARDGAACEAIDLREVAASEFVGGGANQQQGIAGFFEIHRDGVFDIIELAERGDQQRTGDRNRLFLAVRVNERELVVEAVLAADERRAECDRRVFAGKSGSHERAECLRPIRIAPTEIVEDRDASRIGSDCDAIADGLVNRRGGHPVRIEITESRIHAAGDRQSSLRLQIRTHDCGIRWAIVADADQRFHNAAGLDFVVVLADDPFFAAHVERAEDRLEGFIVARLSRNGTSAFGANDGQLAIDNNAAERSLRGIAIGRKNWLFVGSERGGHTAATILTLITSAIRHHLDPFAYLRDVLRRLPTTEPANLTNLLPNRWRPE